MPEYTAAGVPLRRACDRLAKPTMGVVEVRDGGVWLDDRAAADIAATAEGEGHRLAVALDDLDSIVGQLRVIETISNDRAGFDTAVRQIRDALQLGPTDSPAFASGTEGLSQVMGWVTRLVDAVHVACRIADESDALADVA